jgi:hypothetical protein
VGLPIRGDDQKNRARLVVFAACNSTVKGQPASQPIYAFVTTRKPPRDEDDPMDNPGTPETTLPTADIKTLHQELQQLFAGTQNGKRETREKPDGTSSGTCLVIKGK